MKIVTQFNPDLDACLAVWLLRRFGGYAKTEVAFVSTGDKLPGHHPHEVVYVDTSGGKYDHHHTNARVCASSLVLQDLNLESDPALKEMIDFAILVDHGLLLDKDLGSFNLIHIIYGLNQVFRNKPRKVIETSSLIFDSLYAYLCDDINAREEFKRAIHFHTPWGPGVGIETSNRQVRYLAHHRGCQVFVFVDPQTGFRGFQSPGSSGVDFTRIYNQLRQLEPDADWFLHASKELLLCGSAKAPNKKLSRLTLEKLISLAAT